MELARLKNVRKRKNFSKKNIIFQNTFHKFFFCLKYGTVRFCVMKIYYKYSCFL